MINLTFSPVFEAQVVVKHENWGISQKVMSELRNFPMDNRVQGDPVRGFMYKGAKFS